MTLINIKNVETVESFTNISGQHILITTMTSGREVNHFYTNEALRDEHYNYIKEILNLNIENPQDRLPGR